MSGGARIVCLQCRGLGLFDDGVSSTMRVCGLCRGKKKISADKLEEMARQARAEATQHDGGPVGEKRLRLYQLRESAPVGRGPFLEAFVVAHSDEDAKLIFPTNHDPAAEHQWDGTHWVDTDGVIVDQYGWSSPTGISAELIAELPTDSKYKREDVLCVGLWSGRIEDHGHDVESGTSDGGAS